MGKLEGKIALITGGNSGIGLATAKQFVNEGAYVFITGRRGRELAAAVQEIGKNVSGVQGDVSNLDDLDLLFAKIKRDGFRVKIVTGHLSRLEPERRAALFSRKRAITSSPGMGFTLPLFKSS